MDLGTGFFTKLEPFVLISKSAKGAAAAKLILDATSAPGVFVFGELLDTPSIQELLQNEQYGGHYRLLQLFAYGSYEDYLREKEAFPPLNGAQITKLKHLSLVSLAMERRILPYESLLASLQMPTIRDLEDLIIDAIYLDVIRGKLDQKDQQFEVEYTMGRDLAPGNIEGVLAALQAWADTTSSVLSTLDAKLIQLSSQAEIKNARQVAYDKELNTTLKYVLEKQREAKLGKRDATKMSFSPPTGPRADKERDAMDVDDPMEGKGRNRKAPDSSARPLQQRKRNRF